jgi:dTDP-4-dehydrorhamnose reductase
MIYILGTGYVAQAYAKYFLINSIPHRLISRKEVLYTNPINLAAFLNTAKPTLLINAAGFTGQPNVDACEDHKLACLYGNAIMPGFIGELCQSMNIPWIHVSSGCIFDGAKRVRNETIRPIDRQNNPLLRDVPDRPIIDGPYTEEDTPNFTFRDRVCSYYSGSKAMGEELLQKYNNVYICRLRIPFNNENGPRNYLTKLATYDKLISVSNSVSHIDEYIRATYALWDKKAPFGTYNVTNPGIVSARDVVEKLIKAGIRKSEPTWITIPDFNQMVRTPRSNCLLDSTKVTSITPLTEANQAIDDAISNWNP